MFAKIIKSFFPGNGRSNGAPMPVSVVQPVPQPPQTVQKPNIVDTGRVLAALMQQAQGFTGARRFADALGCLNQALSLQPGACEVLYQRAFVLKDMGRWQDALADIDALLTQQPAHLDALNARGLILKDVGRLDEALASLDQALGLDPDFVKALCNRAGIHTIQGRHAKALPDCERALKIQPDFLPALNNCALALHGLKRYEEALLVYERLLAALPGQADFLTNRGLVLDGLKRYDEALASYDAALAQQPGLLAALVNRGQALLKLGRFPESLDTARQVLMQKPGDFDGLALQGLALCRLKRFADALPVLKTALAIRSDNPTLLLGRAQTLYELGHDEETVLVCNAILSRESEDLFDNIVIADALVWRGLAMRLLMRYGEAIESFARARALDPGNHDALWNESLVRLLTGDFSLGWQQYEVRLLMPRLGHVADFARFDAARRWDGSQSIEGKNLLLCAEQGLGDTLHFARYANLLAQRGAQVTLLVQPPVVRLLSAMNDAVKVCDREVMIPEHDLYCPLLSVPGIVGTDLLNIPGTVPYLHPDAADVQRWATRIAAKSASTGAARRAPAGGRSSPPKIGLVWSGNPEQSEDRYRSLTLAELFEHLPKDFQYISLQREVRPADADFLVSHPEIWHFGAELEDFSDTAALIAQMDLVISVCTSVAHLAGAMSAPLWVLLNDRADWRWLLDRDDSPWYPSARLFRKKHGAGWSDTLQQLGESLITSIA